MDMITLGRTGDRPLRFAGERIGAASSRAGRGYRENRYHEVEIFRDSAGRYVGRVAYHTSWEGELPHEVAWLCDDTDHLASKFVSHGATKYVQGFPDRHEYHDKQQRLLADIDSGYQHAVSEAMRAADITEDTDVEGPLRARRDADRYRNLLTVALATVDLSEQEAGLICDALNGHGSIGLYDPDHDDWNFWPAEVEDHVGLNGAEKKWSVNWPKLCDKIAGLDRVQRLAVSDAVDRWWRLPSRGSIAEGLREVGLLRLHEGRAETEAMRDEIIERGKAAKHSADVAISLVVRGESFAARSVGPDQVALRELIDLELGEVADIVVVIDGRKHRRTVRITAVHGVDVVFAEV